MQQIFARWLPAVTLATWSAVLLYFHFAQRMQTMLAPEFRVYAFIAAIVLALMAVAFVVFKGDATCCSSGECGHGLSRLASGKLLTFLILLVPILVAARYTPREGFSATFVENRGLATSIDQLGSGAPKLGDIRKPIDLPLPTDGANSAASSTMPPAPTTTTPGGSSTPPAIPPTTPAPAEQKAATDYLTRTPEGHIVAEVLDLLYAAQDTVLRGDFEGKTVELVGQFMPDTTKASEPGVHRFKAVRMFMTCCAADARPVATIVEAKTAPDFPEMTWVKIIGKPSFPVEKGRRMSVLQAEKIEKTEPPPESMVY